MTNDEKLTVIRNWTCMFEPFQKGDKWHVRVQYSGYLSAHHTTYDRYQDMIDCCYVLVSKRVSRFIVSVMGK